MKRFRWITGLSGWAVGAVGTGLAAITAARQHLGLRLVNALLILVVVSIAVLALLVSAIGRDVDENVDQLQADVNEGFDRLQTDVNHGFERVVDALDGEVDDARADGGGAATPDRPRRRSRCDEPTGGGALGGMLAGGAVGSAFGPTGVVVGGLVGGLLGNKFEYRRR